MGFFQNTFESLSVFRGLTDACRKGESPVSLTGLSLVHKAQLAFALAQNSDAPILIISADESDARRLCDDINTMAAEPVCMLFPAREFVLAPVEGISGEYTHARLAALSAVAEGHCKVVSASVEAVMQPVMPPDQLKQATLTLHPAEELVLSEFAVKLIGMGYVRADTVEGAGQFAIRGSIADVFPAQAQNPVRMELWGDEIDTISEFDVQTQRRISSLAEALIPPAQEVLYDPEALAEQIERLAKSLRGRHAEQAKQSLCADARQLRDGLALTQIDKYLPILHEKLPLIFGYGFSAVLFSEFAACTDHARNVSLRYQADCKILLEEGALCKGLTGHYAELPEVQHQAEQGHFCVYVSNFLQGGEHVQFRKLLSMDALQSAPWGGEMRQLTEDLREYCELGYCTMLAAGSDKTLPIIQADLQKDGIPCSIADGDSAWKKGHVYLMTGSLSGGFSYPETKTALITQAKALISRKKKKHKVQSGQEIRSIADLVHGDLVVHALHGIGRFVGIRKLELENVTKDYIMIQYAGSENLYVPVTQMDLVSKYIGPRDDSGVKLHKLSSSEWQKTRNNVKRAVKDMAKELTALYAKREQTKGFAFEPDDEVQRDFEQRFPYMETDDQLAAIEEIKQDMERERPMERLLCGDVGFGKTEVALRAAMKCVLSGKQCAILVPTTVLAMQHYQTAVRRFEQFPVNVELLSRFRTPRQQKETIERMKKGTADIVIGTHRIVQKDIQFKNLGLAIVDEEQRFGVAHKEKFKEMFAGVDMLTLSATPIPRTLNMAMSGIRDMSVIAEPPQDRYPVQTYVLEYQFGVIVQAIQKELRRGGQVYYIHNRVDTITYTAAKLQQALPEARIGIAHGKMSEGEISEIWRQLVECEIDILVCTTIIETGVDVSNVNTLIIENADCFGLSQLYQLRGRVGRSNRRAYAYFTFKRDKSLTEVSMKRLAAMREFTQFGSGFQIALRDLEIRGAGSILGGRQHGHMEAVGYDMYLKLLGEAVAEERGEPVQAAAECVVDVQINAHIPEDYIESLSQRLSIYRKIAAVQTKDDQLDLLDELIDRYGDPPKEIIGLITVSLLRNRAAVLGISEVTQRSERMYFYIQHPIQEQVTSLAEQFRGRILFNSLKKPHIGVSMQKSDSPLELMQRVIEIMEQAVFKG
ncbi:MAG: transcription-repair coupling factor [Ruminococcus sp.]|nr:transcription-repair coupling factor [Ruminococcus sp.]